MVELPQCYQYRQGNSRRIVSIGLPWRSVTRHPSSFEIQDAFHYNQIQAIPAILFKNVPIKMQKMAKNDKDDEIIVTIMYNNGHL